MIWTILAVHCLGTDSYLLDTVSKIVDLKMTQGQKINFSSTDPYYVLSIDKWDNISVTLETSTGVIGTYTKVDGILGFDMGNQNPVVVIEALFDTEIILVAVRFLSECTSHTVSSNSISRFTSSAIYSNVDISLSNGLTACFATLLSGQLKVQYWIQSDTSQNPLFYHDNFGNYSLSDKAGSYTVYTNSRPLIIWKTTKYSKYDYLVVNISGTQGDQGSGIHQTITDFSSITLLRVGSTSTYVPNLTNRSVDSGLIVIAVVGVIVVIGLLVLCWFYCIKGLLISYGLMQAKKPEEEEEANTLEDISAAETEIAPRLRASVSSGSVSFRTSRNFTIPPRVLSSPSGFILKPGTMENHNSYSPSAIPPPRSYNPASSFVMDVPVPPSKLVPNVL